MGEQLDNLSVLDRVFYLDGSLRDIYVSSTTVDDWRKILAFLAGKYSVLYEIDGLEAPLPVDFDEIQKRTGKASQHLTVYVEGVSLNCHFFCIEEIEFDLFPEDVNTKEKAEAILGFLTEVGLLLNKEVVLTPENVKRHVLVRYEPKTNRIVY